ncbi:MAG: beta-N-acetylhexosaminidase [Thiobacillus sp.]|jgi:beta-N-acetylhexosaminidase|uniref:beta-N-acetylhexosaminidase n=1 Tax=Thiobacillus sp. TaxID=924 RepID=UPI002894ACB2|nr:beta-N-acetylhexosaminidase [Thiobacillus sp.]MDT3707713.1 beta-N-acetylhexosaminidase [Thiobacillus sp.]
MTLGPLMLDVAGTELTDDDRRRLAHPLVGGVILFSRNYRDPAQLAALTTDIHALKSAPLLIAVDHEGGRVQRFREGFTRLPPMRSFGEIWNDHPQRAREMARETGYVLASELRAHGIDFSFAPVLDLDYGASSVIGDRAFHADPHAVFELGQAVMLGMKEAGMAACGKHFPGHGYVVADSHVDIPVDRRTLADIAISDLVSFRLMIEAGLAAVMPAHVIYPEVDTQPAGFSRVWLQKVLRHQLGFDGAIFSDDLCMAGAAVAGGVVERVAAALTAGCDMALVCNRSELADEVLANLRVDWPAPARARLARMHGHPHPPTLTQLRESARYVDALHHIAGLGSDTAALDLKVDPTDYCGRS